MNYEREKRERQEFPFFIFHRKAPFTLSQFLKLPMTREDREEIDKCLHDDHPFQLTAKALSAEEIPEPEGDSTSDEGFLQILEQTEIIKARDAASIDLGRWNYFHKGIFLPTPQSPREFSTQVLGKTHWLSTGTYLELKSNAEITYGIDIFQPLK